jgi:hypothetical protein
MALIPPLLAQLKMRVGLCRLEDHVHPFPCTATKRVRCPVLNYNIRSNENRTIPSLLSIWQRHNCSVWLLVARSRRLTNEEPVEAIVRAMRCHGKKLLDVSVANVGPQNVLDSRLYWIRFVDQAVSAMDMQQYGPYLRFKGQSRTIVPIKARCTALAVGQVDEQSDFGLSRASCVGLVNVLSK